MTVTGSVLIDLREQDPGTAHRRLAQLEMVPDGARVLVLVGPLAVNLRVIQLAHEHAERLHFEVHGEAHAVRSWVDALRTGDALPGVIVR